MCQSKLTEFFAELTESAVKLSGAQGVLQNSTLVGVSDIFYFFLLGGGEGGVQGDRVGVVGFLLKVPEGGGCLREGGGGERAGRVSPENLGGGG